MARANNPLDRFAKDIAPGTLQWIGVRTQRRTPMTEVKEVEAIAECGLKGDHRTSRTPGSARQVTIISREFIQQIAHFMNVDDIEPGLLRRNLVVAGVNLNALRYQQFSIGNAVFEANAQCHPCSRMESALGKGGVAAMLGHGGLCARILQSGTIRIGDSLIVNKKGLNHDLFD
tara:strand:- start:6456 stop:6977 length:522 start_codon:yes stop_codon:yes gene_type:complete